MKKSTKIILAVVSSVLCLIILISVLVVILTKKGVETVTPNYIGVPTEVESVSFNPLTTSLYLNDIKIHNPKDGYTTPFAFRVKQLGAGIHLFSVFSDVVKIRHIKIKHAELVLEMQESKFNYLEIFQFLMGKLDDGSTVNSSSVNAPAGATPSPIPDPQLEELNAKTFTIDYFQMVKPKITFVVLEHKIDLQLPSVNLRDIGKNKNDEKGAKLVEVMQQVMDQMLEHIHSLLKLQENNEILEEVRQTVDQWLQQLVDFISKNKAQLDPPDTATRTILIL